jgi:hypothetical protein
VDTEWAASLRLQAVFPLYEIKEQRKKISRRRAHAGSHLERILEKSTERIFCLSS